MTYEGENMILVIVGPTGVGKTKLSVSLAHKYNAIILNGDSMQVYRDLNIGTAKVTEEEKEGVPHYLFDIVNPDEMYTVYDYQRDLRSYLDKYKDKNIIIVGGTGLYIKAGLYNYEFSTKEENDKTYDGYTNEELLELVKKIDPNTDIHVNNRKRLIRRLNRKNEPNKASELLYPATFIGLTTNRDKLYERINKRVDIMIKDGLIDEVKSLYDKGLHSKAIMTGIGYKELYDYFDHKIDLNEAIELIKQRSRKYAKRQYTWFNNQMDINWFNVDFDNFDNTIKEVEEFIDK
ncbi:MAG TPA: tRNA (adenosine(37)-N6)-dimethylallyltransferase MiaA [Bacilli bacterium]|nr:tRNA (adenosine(37)-N6)-dimethylallyltransferase MiaA [Bacilli bacterium]